MPLTNFIGEPYAGKPHVRIDEGAGKGISPSRSTLPSLREVLFLRKNLRVTQSQKPIYNRVRNPVVKKIIIILMAKI
jgi:hypothetical protein